MGCHRKSYLKTLLDHANTRSMVLWVTKFPWENLKHPPPAPSYIRNVRSIINELKETLRNKTYLDAISYVYYYTRNISGTSTHRCKINKKKEA